MHSLAQLWPVATSRSQTNAWTKSLGQHRSRIFRILLFSLVPLRSLLVLGFFFLVLFFGFFFFFPPLEEKSCLMPPASSTLLHRQMQAVRLVCSWGSCVAFALGQNKQQGFSRGMEGGGGSRAARPLGAPAVGAAAQTQPPPRQPPPAGKSLRMRREGWGKGKPQTDGGGNWSLWFQGQIIQLSVRYNSTYIWHSGSLSHPR